MLTTAGAATAARRFLDARRLDGELGRPDLTLVPFHEIAGRRTGVFERKVPERKRVVDRAVWGPDDTPTVHARWVHTHRADTKVLLADVEHLAAAARTPWDLTGFDVRAARNAAVLRPFDLLDAQRRATVFAAEIAPTDLADRRFAGGDDARIVALSRRTLYFPFWWVPVELEGGSYEVIIEGVQGGVVAWRLPEPYPGGRWRWLAASAPGALALGSAIQTVLRGVEIPLDAPAAAGLGLLGLGAALWWARHPDWRVRSGTADGAPAAAARATAP
jgi:hypothetical protein